MSIAVVIAAAALLLTTSAASAAVTANDPVISDLVFSATNTEPTETSDYTFEFTTIESMSSGETIDFTIYSGGSETAEGISGFGGDGDFTAATATFSSGFSGAAAFPATSTARVTLDSTLNAGTYTLILSGIVNPTESSCFRAIATTTPAAQSFEEITYTDQDIEMGDGGCSDGGTVYNLPVAVKAYGNVVFLDWSTLSVDVDGEIFTADSYALTYATSASALQAKLEAIGQGDTSAIEVSDISTPDLKIVGLTPNTTYYFALAGYTNGQLVGYTQTSTSATTGSTIAAKKMVKPRFSPSTKDRTKRLLKAKWTAPSIKPNSYSIEVRTIKGTKIKTYNSVSRLAVGKQIKNLKPGKTYKFKIRAVYTNVYNVNTDTLTTVKTAWSSYAKPKMTKKP